jgi:hypothetical protein
VSSERRARWRRLPGTGRLLQLIACGHVGVGSALYRRELREIGQEGILGAVPYRGPRATAFWFLVPSPLLWMLGRLLGRAEAAGDAEMLRSVSLLGVLCAPIAIACVPLSGFWGWLAVSLRGLREARRMGA